VWPPSGGAAALLLATGVLACGVQSLATKALKLARATPVTLMGYLGGESALWLRRYLVRSWGGPVPPVAAGTF
jgi:hypothetical protein